MKSMTLQAVIGSTILLLAAQPCHASVNQHGHIRRYQQPHSHRRDIFISSNDTSSPRYDARRSETPPQGRDGVSIHIPMANGISAVIPGPMNGHWVLASDLECPSDVDDTISLAVTSPSNWMSTSTHSHINPPSNSGFGEGCHRGDESRSIGNWTPYVSGAPVCQDSALYSDDSLASSTPTTSPRQVETTSSPSSTTPFLGGIFLEIDSSFHADDSRDDPAATSALPADGSGSGSGSGSTQTQTQSQSESASTEKSQPENAGRRQDGTAVAGLVVAFVAAIYLL